MADANVKKAQVYLNAMFGGHAKWVRLEEDGKTGTATLKGIIRAFQIQNGIDVVGTVGPATLKKMKDLPVISKMNPSDQSQINVCLIQCALFCKGYNAGGITGIYYTTGVNAVKELQDDANIGVTGIIDWKVWSALLSFNWFKQSDYDVTSNVIIRYIQRELNGRYADYLNVRACDGRMSRETFLSLLGALQVEEGVLSSGETLTNLNELNFGPKTEEFFPGTLKIGNGLSNYNKIVQYALQFNGFAPGNFSGKFDEHTQLAVAKFQDFHALTNVIRDKSGEVGVQTMMSLLVSRGDTSRPSYGCDCSTILSKTQANDLKAANYDIVGRYLTGTVGGTRSKAMTREEILNITEAGLRIFPIYQDGGYKLDYFKTKRQGLTDAVDAIVAAKKLGFADNTVIYFAVDFDCLPTDVDNYILDYFRDIKRTFDISELNTSRFKVGIYGPRQVCSEVSKKGLAVSSFVSDMSRGFTGNCGYPLPDNWSFDQFYEFTFDSSPDFALDKDAVSTNPERDKGCGEFKELPEKTNEEAIAEIRDECTRRFLSAIALSEDALAYKFDLIKTKYPLGSVDLGDIKIDFAIQGYENVVIHPDSGVEELLTIKTDNFGKIDAAFQIELEKLIGTLNVVALGDLTQDGLSLGVKITEAMKRGQLGIRFKVNKLNQIEISFIWQDQNIYEETTFSISILLIITITYKKDDYKFEPTATVESIEEVFGIVLGIVAIGAVFIYGGSILGGVAAAGQRLVEAMTFLGIISPSFT